MKTPQSSSNLAIAPPNKLVTFCIVAGSSVLFCSKGVFAKLAYIHGVDALTVLTLRMGFALPFFVALVVFSSHASTPLGIRDWTKLAGLGFLGYYLSSLVNFTGLQYVSIGLERIILYTYPSLVLAASAFVLRKPVRAAVWLACLAAWAGILIAFTGELHNRSPSGKTVFGGALIFTSALAYASFLMLN
ncbi:MAG TPA: EamA family transporter [Terrimicrobiaceae bacterium]